MFSHIQTHRRHVIFSGYDKGLLETLVFSDVALQIQKWRCDMQIRLFAVSKGCTEATKRFLTATNHGDLNLLIESHFGADMGPLTEKGTFEKILASIKQPPEDVLFLTKFLDEYVTAKSANMVAVQLVCRRQAEEVKDTNVPVIRVRSLNELQFEWSALCSLVSIWTCQAHLGCLLKITPPVVSCLFFLGSTRPKLDFICIINITL